MSLQSQIAFITGASSGIGSACAEGFAAHHARLILAARRIDRLEKLTAKLKEQYGSEVYLMPLDVRDRSQVESAVASLPEEWKAIDVLVNNAGLSRGLSKFHEGEIQDWEEMIDTNLKGLIYMTRAVLPGMVERQRGHVINIGSVAGHQAYPNGNVYCATKAAVRSLNESLRLDLLGTPIRVSSVDPGMVETEFSDVRFRGDAERAKRVYQDTVPLTAQDIADVVLFCATRPPHVNISEVLVMPTAQASPTMVHRRSSDSK